MKNSQMDGKGDLEQARMHIQNAAWHLIHVKGADITTPEYDLSLSLLDLKKQLEALAKRGRKAYKKEHRTIFEQACNDAGMRHVYASF
jgi:hypothetical protein